MRLGAGGERIRISDYKTGLAPRDADRIVIDQGRELQRVLTRWRAAAAPVLDNSDFAFDISRRHLKPYRRKGEALDTAATDVTSFLTSPARWLEAAASVRGQTHRIGTTTCGSRFPPTSTHIFSARARPSEPLAANCRRCGANHETGGRTAAAASLTDLDATLLVEAAAGTGKTSLIAGRVAMLLAAGREPQHIAAITFTELAAGELALRIRATWRPC